MNPSSFFCQIYFDCPKVVEGKHEVGRLALKGKALVVVTTAFDSYLEAMGSATKNGATNLGFTVGREDEGGISMADIEPSGVLLG